MMEQKIMDVEDIDTKCIPETMLLCTERIAHILGKWVRFWVRTTGLKTLFGRFGNKLIDMVFLVLEYIEKLAYYFRYLLRVFIEDHLVSWERNLADTLGEMVKSRVASSSRHVGGRSKKPKK